MSKNICECPNPPGGRAICEPDQLAICRIKNGEPQTECQDPPPPLGRNISARDYLQWALTEITGKSYVGLGNRLVSLRMEMLRQGSYRNPITHEEVTFRIPDFVWDKLEAEESEGDPEVNRFHSFGTKDREPGELR